MVPLSLDVVVGCEGHDDNGHEEIGHGQRHQVEICSHLQRNVVEDGVDHEAVAQQGEDDDATDVGDEKVALPRIQDGASKIEGQVRGGGVEGVGGGVAAVGAEGCGVPLHRRGHPS